MSAAAPFRRMAVLGLGLLGGSVAAAARERGVCADVVGYARRPEPLVLARERGFVDAVFDRADGAAAAVEGADLVVLATPVGAMPAVVADAAPGLASGCLVTDVGSVKGSLADRLPGLLPEGVRFVGSHPMAGSHETGVEHARADLLEGACCVVTGESDDDPDAARLAGFWESLGARVVLRAPHTHDEHVAWVSHLPHLLAFAYARALERAPDTAGELAGTGFRDFVRIAHSDGDLWSEILALNAKALAGPLRAFSEALGELSRAVESGDADAIASVEALLRASGERLDSFVPHNSLAKQGVTSHTGARRETDSARSGGENPEIQAAQKSAATRSKNSKS